MNIIKCITFVKCIFDLFDMHYNIFIYFSFAKEFGRPDWEGYGSFIHRWTKRYGIVNKAICGRKESAASPKINLKRGRKLFCSPPWQDIHQMTFTMVMKQPCSTSPCPTGLTALMVTSQQGLQKVKTD